MEAFEGGEGGLSFGGAGDDLASWSAGSTVPVGVGDPGVVGFAAAGQGDVGVVAGGAGLEDGDADVDGVALVAVAGDGPAELDVAAT